MRLFPRKVGNAREDAPWRRTPLPKSELILRNLRNGCAPSPLLSAPFVNDLSLFRVDWLHCVDQGVALDWFGSVMWFLLSDSKYYGGRSRAERLDNMWSSIQAYYDRNKTDDRLHKLTLLMIKKKSRRSAPKLKAMAGVCRSLEGWVWEECNKLLSGGSDLEQAILEATNHLHGCYEALRKTVIFRRDAMTTHGKRFVLLYDALAQRRPAFFRCKPKLHLFVHLTEESDPKANWTYRDEDFGGTASRISRRRGAPMSTKAFSANVLDRFRMEPLVRVL